MHNDFETLQKKCKRYRLIKLMKLVIPFSVFIVLLFSALFLVDFDNPSKSIPKKEHTVKVVKYKEIKKVEPKIVVVEKIVEVPVVKVKQEKVIKDVVYSLAIDDTYAISASKSYTEKQKKKEKEKRERKKVKKEQPQKKIVEEHIVKKEHTKKLNISIKTVNSVEALIKKYKKDKKYSLALKIAQNYYDHKKYSKSLLWTKKANILDRKAEGAWILYAKSEYAKGNKKRAKEILNLYLANANSKEGDALLLTWRHNN